MSSKLSTFICQNCGSETSQYFGRCLNCNSWNSIVEEIKSKRTKYQEIKNIKNRKKLENILSDLSRKVAFRAKKNELGGKTINLKLKTKNFKSISRSKTINNPTQLERKIYKIAKDLLTSIKDNEEYRLIGVGISELVDENFCDLDNLIDTNENNEKKLDQAINSLRDKFGSNIINHGKNYE